MIAWEAVPHYSSGHRARWQILRWSRPIASSQQPVAQLALAYVSEKDFSGPAGCPAPGLLAKIASTARSSTGWRTWGARL